MAQIKAQLYAPSCLQHDTAGSDRATAPAATLLLYGFFVVSPTAKRSRSEVELQNERPPQRCCTPALRRVVSAALSSARVSMGHVDTDISADAVLILRVCHRPDKETRGLQSTNARSCPSAAWQIEGLCIAEPISRAYRAATTASDSASLDTRDTASSQGLTFDVRTGSGQVTHIGDVWCVGTVFCGIRFIWVHCSARRRGVAYAMAEAARRSVCYGYEVPAAHVAFSEPTLMGSRFARRYHARDDFLVY